MGDRSTAAITVRAALTCALALVVLPLSACHATTSCRGLEYDIASSAIGADSERAALDAFLASGDSHDFPRDGWTGPSPSGVFTSCTATVTVTKPPGSSTWFVIEGRTC